MVRIVLVLTVAVTAAVAFCIVLWDGDAVPPAHVGLTPRVEDFPEGPTPIKPLAEVLSGIQGVEIAEIGSISDSMLIGLQKLFERYREGEFIGSTDVMSFTEADSDVCEGVMRNIDGEGGPEAILRRDWAGTGGVFEIVVYFLREGRFYSCAFEGGYGGLVYNKTVTHPRTFSQGRDIALADQIVDLDGDGIHEIIIPYCLRDRGAYGETVVNWPVIFRLENCSYLVSHEMFPEFYRTRILPNYQALLIPEA